MDSDRVHNQPSPMGKVPSTTSSERRVSGASTSAVSFERSAARSSSFSQLGSVTMEENSVSSVDTSGESGRDPRYIAPRSKVSGDVEAVELGEGGSPVKMLRELSSAEQNRAREPERRAEKQRRAEVQSRAEQSRAEQSSRATEQSHRATEQSHRATEQSHRATEQSHRATEQRSAAVEKERQSIEDFDESSLRAKRDENIVAEQLYKARQQERLERRKQKEEVKQNKERKKAERGERSSELVEIRDGNQDRKRKAAKFEVYDSGDDDEPHYVSVKRRVTASMKIRSLEADEASLHEVVGKGSEERPKKVRKFQSKIVQDDSEDDEPQPKKLKRVALKDMPGYRPHDRAVTPRAGRRRVTAKRSKKTPAAESVKESIAVGEKVNNKAREVKEGKWLRTDGIVKEEVEISRAEEVQIMAQAETCLQERAKELKKQCLLETDVISELLDEENYKSEDYDSDVDVREYIPEKELEQVAPEETPEAKDYFEALKLGRGFQHRPLDKKKHFRLYGRLKLICDTMRDKKNKPGTKSWNVEDFGAYLDDPELPEKIGSTIEMDVRDLLNRKHITAKCFRELKKFDPLWSPFEDPGMYFKIIDYVQDLSIDPELYLGISKRLPNRLSVHKVKHKKSYGGLDGTRSQKIVLFCRFNKETKYLDKVAESVMMVMLFSNWGMEASRTYPNGLRPDDSDPRVNDSNRLIPGLRSLNKQLSLKEHPTNYDKLTKRERRHLDGIPQGDCEGPECSNHGNLYRCKAEGRMLCAICTKFWRLTHSLVDTESIEKLQMLREIMSKPMECQNPYCDEEGTLVLFLREGVEIGLCRSCYCSAWKWWERLQQLVYRPARLCPCTVVGCGSETSVQGATLDQRRCQPCVDEDAEHRARLLRRTCIICQKVSSDRHTNALHESAAHGLQTRSIKDGEFICAVEECPLAQKRRSFSSSELLRKHIADCHDWPESEDETAEKLKPLGIFKGLNGAIKVMQEHDFICPVSSCGQHQKGYVFGAQNWKKHILLQHTERTEEVSRHTGELLCRYDDCDFSRPCHGYDLHAERGMAGHLARIHKETKAEAKAHVDAEVQRIVKSANGFIKTLPFGLKDLSCPVKSCQVHKRGRKFSNVDDWKNHMSDRHRQEALEYEEKFGVIRCPDPACESSKPLKGYLSQTQLKRHSKGFHKLSLYQLRAMYQENLTEQDGEDITEDSE